MDDMAPTEAPVLRRLDGGIARLTLNRPAQRNALSLAALHGLHDGLDWAAAEPAARVVVIAGAGPAFCAGHDLREMRGAPGHDAMAALFRLCSEVMLRIQAIPKPVIARVHGVATAAGCQARRHLRPRGRRRHGPLRHSRRRYRVVLLDADGGPHPRRRPQGGDGDAAHRRLSSTRPVRGRSGW